ncbi:hypothetical protein SteCoe_27712 [Stentor coeruleus]|uniref:Uncharacterized protein n=1 Tax=Stentor coeruleus TaxID=5963 RepID=A0A1R2BAF6_9CILI|nr:hypothetical protein SteCoe_27712 [Stentor coeruleus]
MSIELSPSQEHRLHSILDRGLEALRESSENLSRASPAPDKKDMNISSSFNESSKKSLTPTKEGEKSMQINSELKMLQEKLALLESKLSKNSESFTKKSSKRKNESSVDSFKIPSHNSSRNSSARNKSTNRNSYSRDKIRNIENSEKELSKLERSITPNSSKKKGISNSRQIEKIRILVEKERKTGEKLRKENEALRKELSKRDELKNVISKLQEDYNELALSFERSEAVRKKQKELISQLKTEIKSLSNESIPDHIPVKTKKNKRNNLI